jgi:hypothetical protein
LAAVILWQILLLTGVGAEPAGRGQAAPGAAARPADQAAPPGQPAAAGPEDSTAPSPRAGKLNLKTHPSMVAVMKGHGGRQTLAVEYRWKVHENPSLEVRLVPADRAEGTFALPLDFVGQYLTHRSRPKPYETDLGQKVYRCLDRAAEKGQIETFDRDKMTFRIVGQRNSLGRPAVYVLAENVGDKPRGREPYVTSSMSPVAEERADIVFLHLDSWAISDDRLSLDLPPDVFAKRGKLFVWFFRGSRLLWEEQVAWPGSAKAK